MFISCDTFLLSRKIHLQYYILNIFKKWKRYMKMFINISDLKHNF